MQDCTIDMKFLIMKTRVFTALFLLICVFIKPDQIAAQTQTTIYTPKGQSVTAYYQIPEMGYQDKLDWSIYVDSIYPQATELNPPSATTSYNCHGYAWHVSEGGSNRWIGFYYWEQDDEDIYWTAQNPSYIETTEPYASKISYYEDNHSAIQTSTQGIYISKWGEGPLMRHARDYGLPDYEMDHRKYYRLNPYVTGSSDELCANSQRTYSSDTEITGSDYYWTRNESLLDYVSGQDSPDYRVKGKSGVKGNAWVQLQITTPSDEVATNKKYFWVGVPIITNKKVDGGYYYPGMQICPGDHALNVTPVGGDAGTATWTVPPGIVYFVGINELDFTFPSSASGVAITTRSTNTCGTGSNSSFYLTKKYYGCSRSYAMTVYPNPASDNVTITMIENPLLVEYSDSSINNLAITDAKADEPTTYTIRIYNSQSILLSTWTRSGKSFNIPLINMRDGTYIIEVSDGKNSYRQQLFVKHN